MNGALLLILVLLCLLLVGGLGWLQVRLERGAREREELARRLARLEEVWAGDRRLPRERVEAAAASPGPAVRPPTAPPVLHAPPEEQDYAAAEAELRSLGASEWSPDRSEHVADRSDAAPAVEERVPAPLRPAGSSKIGEGVTGERRPSALSLEDFLGGRVLLVVGVVVVLFALGFFLKYAIERELVDPPVRVAIGVFSGLLALGAGDVVRRRGFDVFGHAVMGGGLGALFLSTFFAAARYDLISRPAAFGITACIALAGIVVAMRREAPLLAYLGLLGGYISPAILGEAQDALAGLTGWLLALHVAVLVVVWLRRWPGLDLMALAASSVYYLIWADTYFAEPRVGTAAWCLAALTAMVLAIALAPGVLRRRPLGPTALLTAIAAGAISVSAGFELFHRDHRFALGGAILLLAVAFVVSARRAVGRVRDVAVDEPVLDGCAVAAVAAAIPSFLEGGALAPAWAAAGVVAVLLAALHRSPLVVAGGLVMIALAQIDLLDQRLPMHDGQFTPFANGAFLSWVSPSIAVLMSGFVLRWRSPWRLFSGMVIAAGAWLYAPVLVAEVVSHFFEDRTTYGAAYEQLGLGAGVGALGAYALALALVVRQRRPIAILLPLGPLVAATLFALPVVLLVGRPGFVPLANAPFVAGVVVVAAWWAATSAARGALRVVLLVGAVVVGLVVIGGECAAYGENVTVVGSSREELHRVAQVWMSISFAVYAAVLLGLGFARRLAPLRWSGLAIFLVTLVKVFFVDMAQLPTAHRIGGFLVLGLLLLGASFLYQRARREA